MKKLMLALATTTAAVLAGRRRAQAAGQAQGLLGLCRPDRRLRLFLPARPGPPAGREGARRQGRDRLSSKTSPEGPDAERAFERLAREGCKLIFTTSFGFMDPTLKVAAKFPDVKFEHATGYKTVRQPRRSTTRASTKAATSSARSPPRCRRAGTAGYIVSFPIPEVVMGINSFMLGAQSVNPDFKVKIVWVNSWFDPGKEADAAKALFDQGADIIVQHTDFDRRPAGCRRARAARLRPVLRHDQVRAEGAADLARRQLGPLLHQPRAGGCSTAPGSRQTPGTASRTAPCSWRRSPTCPTT